MKIRHTFGPAADRHARILILGSMPGEASLRAGQYYAHPKNQFWALMGDLFDAGRDRPYSLRLRRLRRARVALWDVVAECVRPGSLDADIDPVSVRPNDFASLFRRAPRIRAVFFNGRKAAALFRRHVKSAPRLHYQTLPSTSPAHAALSLARKRRAWSAVRKWL